MKFRACLYCEMDHGAVILESPEDQDDMSIWFSAVLTVL